VLEGRALAIDDGADAEVLESRVTHTRKSRSAFDGYNRGLQWERTCAESLEASHHPGWPEFGGRAADRGWIRGRIRGGDSLHFAAVLASNLNLDAKSGRSSGTFAAWMSGTRVL